MNKKTKFLHLGTIDYQKAWDYQGDLFNSILSVKSENRSLPEDRQKPTDNYVIFCQHPHVFTLGKSGNANHLLVRHDELDAIRASYYHINRGGDITYHGPGQLVGYPIIDMENFFTDIHRYMRLLEESVIQTLATFGIQGERIPGLTGVWIQDSTKQPRKICALGVKTSRWVTMHGFALNVNTDLRYFDFIVPCGIQDKAVTSMTAELGRDVDMSDVEQILKVKLEEQFGFEWMD